ncbi:MAG TPA: hypothetical protein VFX50_10475 [Gemmatimonadales bacterium]|nr:hypothetical protein [Gemmatimonadales bacterium]
MKFIGGSHHGRDVPIALQVSIYAQRRQWVQLEQWPDPPALPGMPCDPTPRVPETERYRVVPWRTDDGLPTLLLAREGMSRQTIEAFAMGLLAGR